MVNVVVDSDFLSSFLKIDALDTVREYFRTDRLLLPQAVFRELAVTTLLSQVVGTKWLELREVSSDMLEAATDTAPPGLGDLGSGEREAIALAHHLDRAVLLMNDKRALQTARALDIRTVNVPAFLLLYRSLGAEAALKVRNLVDALEEKDHYGFSPEIRRRLMEADRNR